MKKTIFLFALSLSACTIAMAQTGKKARPVKQAATTTASAEKKRIETEKVAEAAKLKASNRKVLITPNAEIIVPVKE